MTYAELEKKYSTRKDTEIAYYLIGWQKQKLTISIQGGSLAYRNWLTFL